MRILGVGMDPENDYVSLLGDKNDVGCLQERRTCGFLRGRCFQQALNSSVLELEPSGSSPRLKIKAPFGSRRFATFRLRRV